MFYTYLWLREDGTPYYVGKGKNRRAYVQTGHIVKVPPRERIVIHFVESEADAFETEIALIWYYGRKDLGTGILRNLTDGGDGMSGHRWTSRQRKIIPEANRGRKRTSLTRLKIREARKRQKSTKGMAGQKHSLSARALMSKSRIGKTTSLETRRKISSSQIGKPKPMKRSDLIGPRTKRRYFYSE